jgi:hypothetical protein
MEKKSWKRWEKFAGTRRAVGLQGWWAGSWVDWQLGVWVAGRAGGFKGWWAGGRVGGGLAGWWAGWRVTYPKEPKRGGICVGGARGVGGRGQGALNKNPARSRLPNCGLNHACTCDL